MALAAPNASLTPLDTALAQDVTLQFRSYLPLGSQEPGVSAPEAPGTRVSDSRYNVKFQLPPKVTTDSRSGEWIKGALRGNEPYVVFKLSGAREMTIEWQYVVGLAGWTTHMVASQVRGLRSYFAEVAGMDLDQALIVRFRMWKHTGPSIFTCRLERVDVSHGKTLIVPVEHHFPYTMGGRTGVTNKNAPKIESPDVRSAYALITNVKIELRLWTSQGAAWLEDLGSLTAEAAKGQRKKVDVPNLIAEVPPEWF